jgi:hypothetical protein
MLTIRRGFYNVGTLAGTGSIAGALGSTLIAGDILLYDLSTQVYGTVNAAANAVVLATC